ncbi:MULTISPECIES: hypothetical protein [Erwinia]|uniref:Type VI secretion system-associated protein n=1 Tax=Erwinia pyrifoliae TaxID=79967 RepID=A0ABY5X6D7_ERWPY|nr:MULTISPECIES: hypothetical protein [Erwinia]ADP10148.1 conserved uncharacterized protein [Erwinia sp. Ejp617]AUX73784.1 hypothetical protein CPI84_15710 [Erwinia pyrifoliae]MCA8875896.1 hypothetical protein [Erwinia pyrifoliae]MCT2387694.1 hypothetical protein [Erwinia pyrifoliae]MCU8585950.1 hypothetical protein [Erwinia pyrifoliae]
MKYWLSGALTFIIASSAWAQDFRLVQSPALKLDIWIDNVKSNSPEGWCARELPLRIVANGKKDPALLDDYLPKVGSFLQKQCTALNQINWQMTDSSGKKLAAGSASKAQGWAVRATAQAPVHTPAVGQTPAAEDLSPAADTTPWVQFSLLDGCHFRTYWRGSSQTSALFVPAKGGVSCGSDGWLKGSGETTQLANGAAKNLPMTFLQGFPVAGLNGKTPGSGLQIVTVNNQRMVLNDSKLADSWMVLPYAPELNGWQANGLLVLRISAAEAANNNTLQQRLNEVRNLWSPLLKNSTDLTIKLVDELHPQLQDPAAGAFRTLH